MSKKIDGEQLRDEIGVDRTGDTVALSDPAAAPPETYVEAGSEASRYGSEPHDIARDSRAHWDGLWLYGAAMVGIAMIAALIVRLAV